MSINSPRDRDGTGTALPHTTEKGWGSLQREVLRIGENTPSFRRGGETVWVGEEVHAGKGDKKIFLPVQRRRDRKTSIQAKGLITGYKFITRGVPRQGNHRPHLRHRGEKKHPWSQDYHRVTGNKSRSHAARLTDVGGRR